MKYFSQKTAGPRVYYTGIGSNGKHVWSSTEFVTLMLELHMSELIEEEHRVANPLQMNLKKWAKWAGADILL